MIESFDYEDCCRASSHTDFNGAVVNYDFDNMKRETKRNYPDGSWIERRYNARGQVAWISSRTIISNWDSMGLPLGQSGKTRIVSQNLNLGHPTAGGGGFWCPVTVGGTSDEIVDWAMNIMDKIK